MRAKHGYLAKNKVKYTVLKKLNLKKIQSNFCKNIVFFKFIKIF